MKEILLRILEGEQLNDTCILISDGTWIWGKIQHIDEKGNLLWLRASPNKLTGRFWTTVVRIDCVQAIDFRSDIRFLTDAELEALGLPVDEIQ